MYVHVSDVQYVSNLLVYRNIDIFIQYRDTILAFGCIDGFSTLQKSNYNKLVCIILIDFFYNQTRHLFTFYKSFNYYSKHHGTLSYHDIFDSDMQYYYLVISHISSSCSFSPQN